MSKCHEATGFLSWAGDKTFVGCKAAGGGCSTAAQPRTALPATQQWGGCSAKNGLFPLQLRCFPPPLFSRLCTGAVLGRGSKRQRGGTTRRAGCSSSPETPVCFGEPVQGGAGSWVRWGKRCQLAIGRVSKERCMEGLCLSWAAFARLSQRGHALPSAHCFRLLGAWVPAQAQGAKKWGKALLLPSLWQPALAPLPWVGCCLLGRPGWQAVSGD